MSTSRTFSIPVGPVPVSLERNAAPGGIPGPANEWSPKTTNGLTAPPSGTRRSSRTVSGYWLPVYCFTAILMTTLLALAAAIFAMFVSSLALITESSRPGSRRPAAAI